MVLENLPKTQRTTSTQAAARSTMVRRLRIVLPAAAVGLIAVFVFSSNRDASDPTFLEEFALEEVTDELEMANPRFAGVDEKGKPFEITAASATRKTEDAKRLDLKQPRAVTRNDGDQTTVAALTGVYEAEAKILELADDVTLQHAAGVEAFTLRAKAATVLIDEEIVRVDAQVDGVDEKGNTIRADRMDAYQDEGRVVFTGNVKLKIQPSSDDGGAGGASGLVLRRAEPAQTGGGPQR